MTVAVCKHSTRERTSKSLWVMHPSGPHQLVHAISDEDYAPMDWTFWAGLILGALLGIAGDLWKRPLDRLLDRRLDHRTTRRGDPLVEDLRRDRHALRDYLVEVILQTTLVGSLIGILSGIAFTVGNIGFYNRAIFTIGQLIAVIGAMYIVRIAGDGLAVARRVNPRFHSQSATPNRPGNPGGDPPHQPPAS